MGKKEITVVMDEELIENIESQLEYGDSRSEWIREAARRRLQEEGIISEQEDDSGNLKVEA